ncbi:SDR family NAD(P)-dependent oxidoreductase [Alkalihalobacillus sp. BA299]|uniref:SDR family NAD(P)-dependent oxidoreductase n=1 Tax=Alkalihalobacillus sp. BA299 TaxID=2815938 RepID=UPI001ADB5717|nr:SDR family NAD(P)-dependent oxidoreductase [Alkalihalobacillus sp. BA299]
MGKLDNKIALITGGGGGLGHEIALSMAKEGAKIVLSDINEQSLKEVTSDLQKNYEADYVVADVSNQADAKKMVDYVVEKFGQIDILVNNAGGSLNTPKYLEDIKEEHWDRVLDVNLKGTFLASQAAVKQMREKGSGKIINMSSIGGRTASLVTGAPYAAAKGGIISLTRRLANEVGAYGINVNAIAPGLIISGDRMHRVFYEESSEKEREKTLNDIPLKELGEKSDVANTAVFLASEESKYITGAVIDVNGGRFMG